MSTTTENQDSTEPTSPADTATPDAPTADTAPPEPQGNSEAARYRRRLRDTETALEAATEQLQRARSRILEQTLSDGIDVTLTPEQAGGAVPVDRATGKPKPARIRLRHVEDLARHVDIDPAELWDDDGNLDTARLAEPLTRLRTERPELFEVDWNGTGFGNRPVPGIGRVPDARPTIDTTWKSVLSGK